MRDPDEDLERSHGERRGAEDTIAAIASAAGGGVGVLRLSGAAALPIARARFRGLPARPTPRHLYHGWWHDGGGTDLDEGLVVWMPGPASYTGEDVVEVHLHGGALGLQRALEATWSAGARPAEAGEFTRRAFLQGRIDLTRAEAVADLIAARTDRALGQARRHLAGDLQAVADRARERLLDLRARVEVSIDFVDDDEPPFDTSELAAEARAVGRELATLAATWRRGQLWRAGARVALLGPVNAGKSSLFNALCRRDRAIVTPIAGTTRDTLEETIDVLGVPIVLVDTAGLRAPVELVDPIEAEGIARAHQEGRAAELTLQLVDRSVAGPAPARRPGALLVATKADLPAARELEADVAVSAQTGEGLDRLERAIVSRLGGDPADLDAGLVITRARHHRALALAAEALELAAAGFADEAPPELIAVDVQEAIDALAELIGLTTIEDVLDRLFARFCIGK